jgi:hypothetical protein
MLQSRADDRCDCKDVTTTRCRWEQRWTETIPTDERMRNVLDATQALETMASR